MPNGVIAEIDRRLAVAQVAGSPNKITAADLRTWAVEYLKDYEEELARFPELAGKVHWNLWMVDAELEHALFAVLVFHSISLEFICGSGNALAIQQWDASSPANPDALVEELRQAFRVPDAPLMLGRETAEAWLGRAW